MDVSALAELRAELRNCRNDFIELQRQLRVAEAHCDRVRMQMQDQAQALHWYMTFREQVRQRLPKLDGLIELELGPAPELKFNDRRFGDPLPHRPGYLD